VAADSIVKAPVAGLFAAMAAQQIRPYLRIRTLLHLLMELRFRASLIGQEENMANTNPFHSSQQMDVYHDDTRCTEGNNIESRYRVSGTGGLPKCSRCKTL
jgi:hypothetical protein